MVVAPLGVPTTVVFLLWWQPASAAPPRAANATMLIAGAKRRRRGSNAANPDANSASMQVPAMKVIRIHWRGDSDAANVPAEPGAVAPPANLAATRNAPGAFGTKISIAFALPGQAPEVGGSAVTVAEDVTNTTENAAGVPGVTL